ncbi:CaaX prenyl protease [Trichoderma atroviride IMI 206040]|uniref:intramembrane prenyl-peptidase Rce1 n=2 Tax=Hypocrea atroviridis TaxID=63577 RepID=G9NKN0_HYPAI|nr:CaaX prenyl protease [Trichoderma atroviride IMI 206040]EHK48453.1 CaaX prenyl protease [Trichoderma atroviride IMI 206040]
MEHPLTEAQAFGLLTAYTFVYVLPLYASSKTRASPDRSRDAPEAIRARIWTVSLSTTACSLATFFILRHVCSGTACSALRLMGYWPLGVTETLKTCLLTGALFAAPLYECLVVDGVWREWVDGLEPLRHVWAEWPAWRNYVAGPITEECLFRAAAVPLLLKAGSSLGRVIFLSPVVFGLAHVHHFYEFRVTHPETPLVAAIARSVLQFAYTSLFGALANFLFLRTGSLLAVVLVHAFCNSMGLPRVWGSVEPYWLSQADASKSRQAVLWSGVYYVLLFGGAYAWWRNLYTLTESPLALAVF